MISKRTRYSLAQLLDAFEPNVSITLFAKYDVRISISYGREINDLLTSIKNEDDETLLCVLSEILKTKGSLRSKISPKYIFDERLDDLSNCLKLDGYIVENGKISQVDPSIGDGEPIEDDLIQALKSSGLAEAEKIIRLISDSSDAYRALPPDYNACLNNIRVSLETLARAISEALEVSDSPVYDKTKWGSIIYFLRAIILLTIEEEKGLVGVYGFISPGSHRPVGMPEVEVARLGRSLALGMCWFLINLYSTQAPAKK